MTAGCRAEPCRVGRSPTRPRRGSAGAGAPVPAEGRPRRVSAARAEREDLERVLRLKGFPYIRASVAALFHFFAWSVGLIALG